MIKKIIGEVVLSEDVSMVEEDFSSNCTKIHKFKKGTILPLVKNILIGNLYVDFGSGSYPTYHNKYWMQFNPLNEVKCTILNPGA